MEQAPKTKNKRLRSPNYPAFSLPDAISKIKILWNKDGKAGAHRSVVLKHLGFNVESGTALRNLSTLKIFSLTSEKNRHIILTNTAIDIMLYSHDKNVYDQSLKETALKPNIYNELYNKHEGSLPSNDALKAELITEYNFNPKVLDRFIEGFRSTLEFAGLLNGKDGINDRSQERYKETREMNSMTDHKHSNQSRHGDVYQAGLEHSFPIPFLKGNKATIVFNKLPVQKSDLEKIKQWIDIFGESLIEDENTEH